MDYMHDVHIGHW